MLRKILLLLALLSMGYVMEAVAADKRFTLVIDAGHGGRDAGAIGKAKVKEKDLTLKFALAFGKLVEQNCPDVKVVYTRKTDKFVELYRRADIANNNKADLFISIHINSVERGSVKGFQTYTLGKSRRTGKKTGVMENLEVAKRENAVILKEDNYQQTYGGFDPNSPESSIMFEFVQDKNMESSVELAKYMQKYVCEATGRQDMGAHQDNLAVLRLTSMPGCLIELGFISTPDEEQFMNSQAATSRYARGIYNAFVAYKKNHGNGVNAPYLPSPAKETKEDTKPVEQKSAEKKTADNTQERGDSIVAAVPVFKVQILTSSTPLKVGDKRLKGRTDAQYYKEGTVLKYTVGASENYNEIYQLRKELLGKFPEAFIIAFRNGEKMSVQEAIREFRGRK